MKRIILIISLVFVLSACSSINNNKLAQAESAYENGKYLSSLNLCEMILTEDPYNKEVIALLKKVFLKLRCYRYDYQRNFDHPSFSHHITFSVIGCNGRTIETVDDAWLPNNNPSEEEIRIWTRRKRIKKQLEEFDNIIIPVLKTEEITIPSFAIYLESLARKNDPDKRDVNILYTRNGAEKYDFMMIDLKRISLSDAITSVFGDDDYKIQIDGNKILINHSKDNKPASGNPAPPDS
ncbi:MAG: membrane lipoprotein lipid attachment site-containing protein [Lentisphaerae bacterium]|nr:membrane lipoprotein lipid attachment site-containing protein [Lentisphaerota bacterium]